MPLLNSGAHARLSHRYSVKPTEHDLITLQFAVVPAKAGTILKCSALSFIIVNLNSLGRLCENRLALSLTAVKIRRLRSFDCALKYRLFRRFSDSDFALLDFRPIDVSAKLAAISGHSFVAA